MLCGCGIIIKWPRWFHRNQDGNKNDYAAKGTTGLPTYASAIEVAVARIPEIDPLEVIAHNRNMRSGAPSPEPLRKLNE